MLESYDLDQCSPMGILKMKKDRKEAEGLTTVDSFRDFKDMSNEIMYSYNDRNAMLK